MLSSLVSSPFPPLVFDCLVYAIVCYCVLLCAIVWIPQAVKHCRERTGNEAKLYDVITSNGIPADANVI